MPFPIGMRCEAMGYEFTWPAYSDKPYFVTPTGQRVELVSDQFVPYLVDKHNLLPTIASRAIACPAPLVGGASSSGDPAPVAARGDPGLPLPREGRVMSDEALKVEANSREHMFDQRHFNKQCKHCLQGTEQRATKE